jgi:hypothetical protein
VMPEGLFMEVTVAVKVTAAPALAGFGVAVRTVVVRRTSGGGGVEEPEEPPQPARREREKVASAVSPRPIRMNMSLIKAM